MFEDRRAAGQEVAAKLKRYAGREDVVVLGLARGGLPVADEVAKALDAPLDVFLVRKLGVPGHRELAMGAIASGGVRVLNEDVVARLDIGQEAIDRVAREEQQELERREQAYRGDRERVELEDQIVILVDDGLATGASMRAAVEGVHAHHPKKTVVAVPTGSPDVCADLESRMDEVICVRTPSPFWGVGAWYGRFPQIRDAEVRQILEQSAQASG